MQQFQWRITLTWYFPLAPRSVPSLSQVTMGLGFPKAVQVMVTLPPSLASMYCGGVSVKVGGAAERPGAGVGGLASLLPCMQHPPAPGTTPTVFIHNPLRGARINEGRGRQVKSSAHESYRGRRDLKFKVSLAGCKFSTSPTILG